MADVFISYPREDKDFVLRLHEALKNLGREDWVDWKDIPPTAEWMGEAAASEQVCSGAFDNGEFLLELFPQEREYQVQFSGEVPGCAVTTQYPAFKVMARLFGKWHDEYKNLDNDWAALAADMKNAHDSFAAFSATEKKQEPVTFSATAEPDMKKDPKSNFPVMHFYPLPTTGARLAGTGKVQLIVSTSVFPTTLSTEAHWSLQAVK